MAVYESARGFIAHELGQFYYVLMLMWLLALPKARERGAFFVSNSR
jgi:hypothetical protein